MRARSLVLVGAAPAMFAWHLVVATVIATDGSYWELLGTTILAEGDTHGGSSPKYFGLGL
jgi:hypothetical protein